MGSASEFVLLRQQLDIANEAVIELQREVEKGQREAERRIGEEMGKVKRELESGRRRERRLEKEVANAQHQNELLEFQLVEMTEIRQLRVGFGGIGQGEG